jgi:hypothetical protein
MNAALMPSRLKIRSKVRLTDVVPAPEEPVTEIMGCLTDIIILLAQPVRNSPRSPNS